jgi:hypothetical protein
MDLAIAAKNAVIFLNSLAAQFARRYNKTKLNHDELINITQIVTSRLYLFGSDARAINSMFVVLNTRANFNFTNNASLKVLRSWMLNIRETYLTFDNNDKWGKSTFYTKVIAPLISYFLANDKMAHNNSYIIYNCIDNMNSFFDKVMVHNFTPSTNHKIFDLNVIKN